VRKGGAIEEKRQHKLPFIGGKKPESGEKKNQPEGLASLVGGSNGERNGPGVLKERKKQKCRVREGGTKRLDLLEVFLGLAEGIKREDGIRGTYLNDGQGKKEGKTQKRKFQLICAPPNTSALFDTAGFNEDLRKGLGRVSTLDEQRGAQANNTVDSERGDVKKKARTVVLTIGQINIFLRKEGEEL